MLILFGRSFSLDIFENYHEKGKILFLHAFYMKCLVILMMIEDPFEPEPSPASPSAPSSSLSLILSLPFPVICQLIMWKHVDYPVITLTLHLSPLQ